MFDSPPDKAIGAQSLIQHLVESVQDYAIFAMDPQGRIVSWNRGAQAIKGYSPAEAIGMYYSRFFTEEDRAAGRPARLLGTAVEEGRATDQGWRLRKDGTRFWADAVITAVRSSEGELIGFAKVTRDLTERRAAEEALRNRERQLTDTQHLARLGSWEWDIATDAVTWTDELYRIYGLAPERFPATFAGYLERVHPDDRERVRHEIEKACRDGTAFEFEERIVRPDGTMRVLRSHGRAVPGEMGGIARLTGACLDITELKEAEERGREILREQTARAVAEAFTAGLRFLVSASEVLALPATDETSALRGVATLAVQEFADWCSIDLVAGGIELRRVAVARSDSMDDVAVDELGKREPSDAAAWHVINTGEAVLYPECCEDAPAAASQPPAVSHSHGRHSAVTVPLSGPSGVIGALTLARIRADRPIGENDVWVAMELGRHAALSIEATRLHRQLAERNAELEVANAGFRQRTAEAERANRAKSDFLAAMSHELRTPLNAIFGYADLLDLELHGPISAAQHDALERIKRNQRALLSLINDVLNFAKLEAGRLQINMSDVPIDEAVRELEAVVGPQVRAKQLHYEWSSCEPEIRVRGERERIEQILLNLLTNAIKFTEPGGSITLSVEPDQEVVRLRVSDTGPGIPQDRLAAIFDPFVQISRLPEESGQRGVGLGLAISRDLADAMGATLQVESTVGKGSTFTLTLQRAGLNRGTGG